MLDEMPVKVPHQCIGPSENPRWNNKLGTCTRISFAPWVLEFRKRRLPQNTIQTEPRLLVVFLMQKKKHWSGRIEVAMNRKGKNGK